MDGKHITIQAPNYSGSDFFHYKSFSVGLFVVAYANYQVMYMDFGCQGRISGVFANTRFKKMLMACKLNLPANGPLPGRTKSVPYVFLRDDTFPLSPNVQKPYPGHQEKGLSRRITIDFLGLERCQRTYSEFCLLDSEY
jgi:hypothetical protein